MREQMQHLKKYAVKLKTEDEYLGSGVLWRPEQNAQNKLYVFTAAHVVKGYQDIIVEFLHNDELKEVHSDNIIMSDNYQEEGGWFDTAIIILDYNYEELPSYRVLSFEKEEEILLKNLQLLIVGFPESGTVRDSFQLSLDTLLCNYECFDGTKACVKYKISTSNINNVERNEELIGFSGGGVFTQIGAESILVGIHKGSDGTNAARGNLFGVTTDYIRKLCYEKNCDIPQTVKEVNGNLSDREQYFVEEILNDLENDDDYEKMAGFLSEILKQDMVEIINSTFCGFCEECRYNVSYHRCRYFRGFLLLLLIFLRGMEESEQCNLNSLTVWNQVPVYFICSEGKWISRRDRQTQLKMQHFIYALKTERNLHYIKDNSIIIWGSERSTRDNQRKCGGAEYKKALNNIARTPGSALDIANVVSEPKPKAIIHISEIMNMLSGEDLSQLKQRFEEYMEKLRG